MLSCDWAFVTVAQEYATECPPLNTWASKVGPREMKFDWRYVRRIPNTRIFENSNIVQCRAKPNIQIFGVPIPPILVDGRQMVSQL
ncbi:hypothetical protein L3X38_005343 [Prunus dulcis]|uniref:Uncharacterized protein n=1 Tax=Prunus dulcis TaxID=3755 RepID=A0AAD4ZQT0_PRUDU|nr:hypothetical protein L3X38_005343 [Prunus dulcis]